jgi:ABC-2 type transport system ATP-binding protein
MYALDIKNLTKTYSNGVVALKGINLKVKQGDFFALLGPNGAGKSTTIGIISSLVNKTKGEISILGYDLDRQPSQAKSSIGLVPQEFNFNIFHPLIQILVTQAGYYGISRSVALERTEKYLKKLHLWDKRHEIARNLSGGQKRRLMIAAALVHEPPLLILDEPTAGVDIEVRRSMWSFLQEINQRGITIILTTHYLEEAETLCKNIAIINHGHIIEHTTMRKILQQLHTETFVLDLANELTETPNLPHYPARLIDKNTLEVEIKSSQNINELFEDLSKQKITVLSMRNKANRLEELFLHLTTKEH